MKCLAICESSRRGDLMKCLIECSLSHQFVERDSILGQGAYLIGLITWSYNYRWCIHLGFCFTLMD